MIVKPWEKKTRRKPWTMIVAAGVSGLVVIEDSGARYAVKRGRTARTYLGTRRHGLVYSMVRPSAILLATDARFWSARMWQGAISNLTLDGGPTVLPLRQAMKDATPEEAGQALTLFAEALTEHGIPLGSFSGMTWALWRASLYSPVTISGPDLRDALYGGRKEALFPGEYANVAYWDLSAAYPTVQAADPYPLRMRQVTASSDISDGVGLAYAQVRIPSMQWSPLPVRIGESALCYGYGDAEGWWSWRELVMAREVGCTVTILASLAGFHYADLFGPWWELCQPLREMPGYAGKLAKAVTSTLWGQFALSDDVVHRVRWEDQFGNFPIIVPEQRRQLPHKWTVHIAAETTARVRERLWREGLQVDGAIYCDTDAVICGRVKSPVNSQWVEKRDMVQVDIRGPQVYRYLCSSCAGALPSGDGHRDWHYVVGGISSTEVAERIFRRDYRRHHLNITPGQDGLALPSMNLDKARRLLNVA